MRERERAQLREDLAALCHEQWSSWMRRLWTFVEQGERGEDILVLPARARLRRQMHEPFSQLSDDEKEQDRLEADRILAVLDKHRARGRGKDIAGEADSKPAGP